ncbi:hypothetical protein [Lactiplantibacillus daowaiensis]|uniref:Surface layer protein A domain-containing protein n=1 Tax=Lactiplantibacillus daowaiensis TaxID=2559918 RepID=A0ABW1RZZ2_9LACO|nr:hypothetical protein [Lactiplantibacillus daowaiensis]
MNKLTTIIVTMGIALMVSGAALPVAAAVDSSGGTTASAATRKSNIQRNHMWKKGIKHRDYKVANTDGKTYIFSGPMNNIKLKANHSLKNYKQSTWTRKGIVQIKQNNKWMMYYYVTTGKKVRLMAGLN